MSTFLGGQDNSENGFFQSGYIDRLFFINTSMLYKISLDDEENAKAFTKKLDDIDNKLSFIIKKLEEIENGKN